MYKFSEPKEIEFIELFFNNYIDWFKDAIDKFLNLYTMLDKYKRKFEQLRI